MIVIGSFQPRSSHRTLVGWWISSDANLRLSECQPRPRFGSSHAVFSAFLHLWGRRHDDRDDCPYDLDGNCVAGNSDLTTLLLLWGPCPGADG